MKQCLILLLLTTLFFLIPKQSIQANHLVGGELTYTCLGNDRYQINLTIYTDCYQQVNTNPFDELVRIFVFDLNGNLLPQTDPAEGVLDFIPIFRPTNNFNPAEVAPPANVCIETIPPEVCVAGYTYSKQVTFPPRNGGYTLVYQRFSRNSTIINLSLPQQTGVTYSTQIPDPGLAPCNNAAVFNEFPPTVVCVNSLLKVDQSAFDVDGDSLVYSLCEPLNSSWSCAVPGSDPLYCPNPLPPPYEPVNWRLPYSAEDPLGGGGLAIDSLEGILTGLPTQVGQFVVGICVTEYRNGIPINTVRRDFQFNVSDCKSVIAAVLSNRIKEDGTFVVNDCEGGWEVQFINLGSNTETYFWDFGDTTTTQDQSTDYNPTYIYPDIGTYQVLLVANPGLECTDTAIIEVNLFPTLTSNFSYGVDCPNVPILFTDLSTNTSNHDIISWEWDFGDGSPIFPDTTETNPTHVYTSSGPFTASLTITNAIGCISTFTQTVNLLPAPDALFFVNSTCIGEPTIFDNQSNPNNLMVDYIWDFGDGNTSTSNAPSITHTYAEPGSYFMLLTATGDNGCIDKHSGLITIYPPIVPSIQATATEICVGDSLELMVSGALEDSYTFSWSNTAILNHPDSSTVMAFPTQNTTFTVTVSNPSGCSETASIDVIVHPLPAVDAGKDTTVCYDETIVLQGTTNVANPTINWTGRNWTNNNSLQPTYTARNTDTLILEITDNNGCIQQDEVIIKVIPKVIPQIITSGAAICVGDSIQLTASGGIEFLWSSNDDIDNADNANLIVSPETTTDYSVNVRNECFETDTAITVAVYALPEVDAGLDQTINIGDVLTLGDGTIDNEVRWFPTNGLSDEQMAMPTAQPLETTTYTLTTTDENGCVNTDKVTITVENNFDIILPDAFSPNNDQVNDRFEIVDTKGLEELVNFQIYDRWGKKVFESDNFREGWNGEYKNNQQTMGYYVYVIHAKTFLKTDFIKKGHVLLLR